ncbi:MAG: glutamine synthetase family protein [Acidimicrobiales bacterium]|nr:glutamine synthetase family protein [Acidimicrobiales bacterium]
MAYGDYFAPVEELGEQERILAAVRAAASDHVKVAVVDIDGVLRGKYLDVEKFVSSVAQGFGFCDVVFGWDANDQCYDNTSYTGWHSGYPDGEVRIDLATHRTIPWEDGRHFFLGDYVGSTPGVEVCPRLVLKSVLQRAKEAGYSSKVGLEFEWFNFLESPASVHAKGFRGMEPLTPGMFGYSVVRQTHNQPFFDALLRDLRGFGVPLEGLHCETGPGVFEAAVIYSGALEAADRGVLFKAGVKEIAHRFGILPSFMARWNTALPGCSGHVHQSLWTADGERNVFFDGDADWRMSPRARSYVAGVLHLLPELLALVAPTVNSYKRLVDGFWAPTRATWGIDNRTVACRFIPGTDRSTRLEFRVPGADVNPHLAVAASLGAGLWGIEHGLELDEPTSGSGYTDERGARLPRTLAEATERLHGSAAARELFGDAFVDHFVATREWEWRQYCDAVTDWELARYFEII